MQRLAVGSLLVAMLIALSSSSTSTQSGARPTSATDVTKADIEAVLKHPEGGGDRQIKVVDMGKYNVAIGVLHRNAVKPSATGTVNGIAPPVVLTTGRPCATASASAMPYPS